MSVIINNIRESLENIGKQLKDQEERREKLIKGTRDVIILCGNSIVALHHNELEQATQKMNEAKSALDELRTFTGDDLYRYISVAEQELVEAFCLKAIVTNSPLPTMNDLGVSGPSYITGLLDCIGEIKRLVYDRMRSGKENDAEKLFSLMEDIYMSVYPFAVYDNLVNGVRKKLDVARSLVESIRAVVTEENRRSTIIKAVRNLEREMQTKGSDGNGSIDAGS